MMSKFLGLLVNGADRPPVSQEDFAIKRVDGRVMTEEDPRPR